MHLTRLFLLALVVLLGAAGRDAGAAAGGGGGQPFELRCNENEYMVGLQGTTGWYVDEFFLFCASLNPDGSHGIAPALRGQAGLPGNSDYSLMCVDGAVVTGLFGRAGAYVDSVSVRCSPLAGGQATTTAQFGGAGGTSYSETCDATAGRVAIGVRGRAGWWIDQVEIICGELEIPPPEEITLVAPANEAPLANLSPTFAWHPGFATVLGVRYDLCVDVQDGGDCSAYFKQDIEGPIAADGTASHAPIAQLDLAGSTFGFWRVRACTTGGCTLSGFNTFLAPPGGGNLAGGLCPTYQNARCANCHGGFSHNENATCTGCHTGALHPDTNQAVWLLAPEEQLFAGATCGEICRIVRNWAEDPNHDFLHHIATDPLIQWGFEPSAPMLAPQGGVVAVGEQLNQQPAPLGFEGYVSVSTAWYRAGMPCDPENDDFGPLLAAGPGMAFGPPPGWQPRPPKLPPPKLEPVWWLDVTTSRPDRSRLIAQKGLPPECERLIGKARATPQIERLRPSPDVSLKTEPSGRGERERLLSVCKSLLRR